MLENYLECYHCPTQHPGFSAIIDVDPDTYSLQPHDWFLSQIGPVRQAALDGTTKKEIAYDPHGPLAQSQYHFLWPNITISINPGLPNLSIEVWNPDGPGRTRGFSEQYFGADVPEDFAREMMAFDDQVGAEDDALTDSVQLGLQAGIASARPISCRERATGHPLPEDGALGTLLKSDQASSTPERLGPLLGKLLGGYPVAPFRAVLEYTPRVRIPGDEFSLSDVRWEAVPISAPLSGAEASAASSEPGAPSAFPATGSWRMLFVGMRGTCCIGPGSRRRLAARVRSRG